MIPNKHHCDKARKYHKLVCDAGLNGNGDMLWHFKYNVDPQRKKHFTYSVHVDKRKGGTYTSGGMFRSE